MQATAVRANATHVAMNDDDDSGTSIYSTHTLMDLNRVHPDLHGVNTSRILIQQPVEWFYVCASGERT